MIRKALLLTIPFAFAVITAFQLHTPAPKLTPAKMEGKIVKRDFRSKKGVKVRDTYDLFFETSDTAYFIKMPESKITQQDAYNNLNKPISVKYKLKDGLWDTNDPKVQSRTGPYIVIYKIL